MNTQLMGAAIALALATSSAQANLVVNGGFETGDFTGWTQVENTGFAGVNDAFVHSGTRGAYFGPASLGGIQQDLATTAGATYSFDFWLENTDLGQYQVYWNGNEVVGEVNPGDFSYRHQKYTVTASGTSTSIEFLFKNDNNYFGLDDVSVTAVPESSTWLAGAGASLAMLGSFVRRNRK